MQDEDKKEAGKDLEPKTQPERKVFNVKLYQSHWLRTHTETFQIDAEDEKEALAKAMAFIEEHKDLPTDDENKWDLEVEPPIAPAASESAEPLDVIPAIPPPPATSETPAVPPTRVFVDQQQPNGDLARKDEQIRAPLTPVQEAEQREDERLQNSQEEQNSASSKS